MLILRAFEWLGQTPLSIFLQQSTYAFAVVQMLHLLALAALGGGILLIDLRILGIGLKTQIPKQLTEDLLPYLTASLSVSIITGLLLLTAEPLKCYYNTAFRLKMLFLVTAILFSAILQRPRIDKPGYAKPCAIVSLLLWLAVGLAGRAIGLI